MNKLILMGNFTRDPEIRYSQGSNLAIARFSIAINRRFAREGEDNTDFFNCTAFGKTAEFVEKYFHKGMKAAIVGRIENDNYTNKNGEKVYSVKVIVEEIEFCEKKGSSDNDNPGPPPEMGGDDDFVQIPEGQSGDIPFFNQQ